MTRPALGGWGTQNKGGLVAQSNYDMIVHQRFATRDQNDRWVALSQKDGVIISAADWGVGRVVHWGGGVRARGAGGGTRGVTKSSFSSMRSASQSISFSANCGAYLQQKDGMIVLKVVYIYIFSGGGGSRTAELQAAGINWPLRLPGTPSRTMIKEKKTQRGQGHGLLHLEVCQEFADTRIELAVSLGRAADAAARGREPLK